MSISRILEKCKLIEVFETELSIDKNVFISEMEDIVEKGYYSPFLIMLDTYAKERKKYIGTINSSRYIIRERFTIDTDAANNFAIIKSEFFEENGRLKVKTKLIGMEFLPFVLRFILLVMYVLTMLLVIIEFMIPPIVTEVDMRYVLPPVFVSIVVYFFTYRPYRIARNNIKEKRKDIESLNQEIEKTEYSKNKRYMG